MENLGLRIYELRKAKGLTQEELAARMGGGTNRSMICKWERGVETPNLTSAKRLISALGCSLHFLVTGTHYKD
nr:MAG TPA: helix-turn-helix domain protein [Caudoviricetes sp.]